MFNKKSLNEQRNLRAMKRRKADLKFLKILIQSGRALSVSDGDRFMTIIDLYPLEIWYLCQELNPEFYNSIGEMVELNVNGMEVKVN